MSSSLVTLCLGAVRALFAAHRPILRSTVKRNALVLATGMTVHGVYVYGTQTYEKIYVLDTYQRVYYGSTVFMVVDGERRHFHVGNSLWFWRWDAIEDWHRIQRGYPLSIKRYGWRVPFLGLFPTIVGLSDKT